MLPKAIRAALLDAMSTKTMRFVTSIPTRKATGQVARIYEMIAEDFFINGSLTSHSRVPDLMAGVWATGRETILVADRLPRHLKEAMTATLSQQNDCPYCADMLISLVHGSGHHDMARGIFAQSEEALRDDDERRYLTWVRAAATAGPEGAPPPPFAPEALPEAIGSLLQMSYVNRFSHVVMNGSPVAAPLGLERVKDLLLRVFGAELKTTTERELRPGRALDLLPDAELPSDMQWARANPRIAGVIARWAAAVEREAPRAVPDRVRAFVEAKLDDWQGEAMPLSRSWVDRETEGLHGMDRAIAKLALVIAKSSAQLDDGLVLAVLEREPGEIGTPLDEDEQTRFIRIMAWACFAGARRIAARAAAGSVAAARRDERTAHAA